MITIKDFINRGIFQTKIIESDSPFITWSLSRKIIVSSNDYVELIKLDNGNFTLSIENNINIPLLCFSEITDQQVDEINKSEDGIIMINHDTNFRFAIIPTKEFVKQNYKTNNK